MTIYQCNACKKVLQLAELNMLQRVVVKATGRASNLGDLCQECFKRLCEEYGLGADPA
jgi:hypothetical protein